MDERHPERAHLVGQVGVVGDHHHHRHVQLAAAVAPQQIQQAVIFLGRHDGDPLGLGGLGQAEVHAEPRGDPFSEVALQRIAGGGQTGQMKDGALHERSTGLLGGMLIQRHDVGAGVGQEGADRGHQPRPVGAAQQQPSDVLDRQRHPADRILAGGGAIDGDIGSGDHHVSPIPLVAVSTPQMQAIGPQRSALSDMSSTTASRGPQAHFLVEFLRGPSRCLMPEAGRVQAVRCNTPGPRRARCLSVSLAGAGIPGASGSPTPPGSKPR